MSIIDKRVVCPDCGGKGRPCFLCKGTGYILESEREKILKERINNCQVISDQLQGDLFYPGKHY